MEIEIQSTEDGSHTLWSEDFQDHYHSYHGAVRESQHVFIHHGMDKIYKDNISIFEVGFGTGLNAFLSLIRSLERGIKVHYYSIEKFPLSVEYTGKLNYGSSFPLYADHFSRIHECSWNRDEKITSNFTLHKIRGDLLTFSGTINAEVVYFDAFNPGVQPEMWSDKVLEKVVGFLEEGGVLVTYSAKGVVRRSLKAQQMTVEKLPGPPGKRDMTRAIKKAIL